MTSFQIFRAQFSVSFIEFSIYAYYMFFHKRASKFHFFGFIFRNLRANTENILNVMRLDRNIQNLS